MSKDNDLTARHCKPCEGGVDPMSADRATTLLEQIPGWKLSESGETISRRFTFKNSSMQWPGSPTRKTTILISQRATTTVR